MAPCGCCDHRWLANRGAGRDRRPFDLPAPAFEECQQPNNGVLQFGISALVLRTVSLLWAPRRNTTRASFKSDSEVLPGIRLLPDQVFVLGLTIVLVIALHAMLKYSLSPDRLRTRPSSSGSAGEDRDGCALDLGIQRDAAAIGFLFMV